MRGLTPDEAASLRRNMPGTPNVPMDPSNRDVNQRMLKRGLLKMVVNPKTGDETLYNTTPLGFLALYCYIADTTLSIDV